MTHRDNPFIGLMDKAETDLPASDAFTGAGHSWSQPEIDALILALAARRPLLVRGEAGSGKSQIARAAARQMGDAPLLVEVIHPRFEALDLLYQFDQVSRLADAQIGNELDRSNFKYVKHGRLWQAFELARPGQELPVLLIDEIDKADADLPNALLDVMGNRSFQVPMLGHLTISAADGCLPLIIITTNEERELPAAFVRRCAVLNLNPPVDNQDFIAWLLERGKVHRHLKVDPVVCQLAAQQVLDDRLAAANAGYPKVGLAEYIDLLTAVDQLTPDLEGAERIKKQIYWINRLSAYALVKNAGQSQKRAKRSAPDIPSN